MVWNLFKLKNHHLNKYLLTPLVVIILFNVIYCNIVGVGGMAYFKVVRWDHLLGCFNLKKKCYNIEKYQKIWFEALFIYSSPKIRLQQYFPYSKRIKNHISITNKAIELNLSLSRSSQIYLYFTYHMQLTIIKHNGVTGHSLWEKW